MTLKKPPLEKMVQLFMLMLILFQMMKNGPAEGINAKLKIINTNGFGYTNFERFRKRCIYSINKNVAIKN